MTTKSKTCSKCGVTHEGDGVSRSMRKKTSLCGTCYKAKESLRKKIYRAKKWSERFEVGDKVTSEPQK